MVGMTQLILLIAVIPAQSPERTNRGQISFARNTTGTKPSRFGVGKPWRFNEHRRSESFFGSHFSPISWGGGDPWAEIGFSSGGKQYNWQGPYIPIAVQPDGGRFYLVVFDRESAPPVYFRFYRSGETAKWEEIKAKEFPRHLAIQNTWLRKVNPAINEYEIVERLDPTDPSFQSSLTAQLWNYLENPTFRFNEFPSEAFLKQFKATWIRTANTRQPQSKSPRGGAEHEMMVK